MTNREQRQHVLVLDLDQLAVVFCLGLRLLTLFGESFCLGYLAFFDLLGRFVQKLGNIVQRHSSFLVGVHHLLQKSPVLRA